MSKEKLKIAIVSGKGGVGKSMLASSLAILLSKEKKIIALDCDVDAPNLAIWLNEDRNWEKKVSIFSSLKPKVNHRKCKNCQKCVSKCKFGAMKIVNNRVEINPFLCEGCGLCEVLCPEGAIKMMPVKNGEIRIKRTKYGFVLVSGYLLPGETGSGKVVDEIKSSAESFDYQLMIIDSAPGRGCPVISALKDVDLVILVGEPTLSGFTDLKKVKTVVDHFHIPYFVVVNKWNANINNFKKIKRWAGSNFLGKISYDKRIFEAISRLLPIIETDLPAKEEITKIYQKLKEVLF